MINIEFLDADQHRVAMAYDVHPTSQAIPLRIPEGAVYAVVWLGIK